MVSFAPGSSNILKRCLLCLHEKLLFVTYHNPAELLSKRSDLMAKCRHENKFSLSNYKVTINNLCMYKYVHKKINNLFEIDFEIFI